MVKAVIFDMYETLITHYNSPLYFGTQMAMDAGISEEAFQSLWRPMESDRTIGKITLEEAIEMILKKNNCYSKELFEMIVKKRIASKEECFEHLNTQIIPMLNSLKERGIKIGLISNCFSEEAGVIRKSILYPYFDAFILSYEQGMEKPDAEIYKRCLEKLMLQADECLYVGDGGSYELEAAREIGMNVVQAVWYLREGTNQPSKRKPGFEQIENPLDILNYI